MMQFVLEARDFSREFFTKRDAWKMLETIGKKMEVKKVRKKTERFDVKDRQILPGGIGELQVVVDKKTGINYIMCVNKNGISGITPMLDEDRRVVIDKWWPIL